HSLDLRRIDRDAGDADVLSKELLRDQAAEGVADEDRRRLQRPHDLGEVAGDVVDALVRDAIGILTGLGYGGGFAGPARSDRLVTFAAEALEPRAPAR